MPRTAALVAWLAARGGVAHTRDAAAAGHSPHTVKTAVADGRVERIRRSWLVLRGTDAGARSAASVGGRVTCVSAAARIGLWTPPHAEVHVAVPRTASRLDAVGLRLHCSTPPIAVARTETSEPLVNVLFHVARCLPRREALAVWESALRLRRVEPAELALVRWRNARAAELARVSGVLSDSGIETVFVDDMRRAGIEVRQQVWLDGHPVDGLIGRRLVVQIDGFRHHQAADRRRDLAADARLRLRGYTVLRFDYQQVLFDRDLVLATVRMAIAQGLHLAA